MILWLVSLVATGCESDWLIPFLLYLGISDASFFFALLFTCLNFQLCSKESLQANKHTLMQWKQASLLSYRAGMKDAYLHGTRAMTNIVTKQEIICMQHVNHIADRQKGMQLYGIFFFKFRIYCCVCTVLDMLYQLNTLWKQKYFLRFVSSLSV